MALQRGFISIELMAETAYELAAKGVPPPELLVRAQDMEGLALSFKAMISEAADTGDFTQILSPDRTFVM
jgi:hypothetical protein